MEKRYNKTIFWKKDFDEQARFLLYAMGGHLVMSDHLIDDNLSGKRGDFDHSYSIDDIKRAFEKASAGKYYCYEVRVNEYGNVTRAVYRVQIDNKTDVSLCVWAYDKVHVHTAWKTLVNMRAILDDKLNKKLYARN